MKFRTALFGLAAFTATACMTAAPADARTWEVKMLNSGPDGSMSFAPAFLRIARGDTVHFIAADKGHNAESIPELTPNGGTQFKGNMSQDVSVKFTKAGLYGYECMPHYALGMVGLIQVDRASNRAAFAAGVQQTPPMARTRLLHDLQMVK